MRFPLSVLATLLLATTTLAQPTAAPPTLYLSPTGNDANPGTQAKPLASLAAALSIARDQSIRHLSLSPGDYPTPSLLLDARDTGLTIEGNKARLVAGTQVPASAFKPVTDPDTLARLDPAAKGKLLVLDLGPYNLTSTGPYPDLFVGNGRLLELYINASLMPLSRWPNNAFVSMAEVKDSGLKPSPHGGTFVYRGDRPSRWKKSLETTGVFLTGYWRVPWVAQTLRVTSIDEQAKTITFAAPLPMGIGSKYSKEVNGTRIGDGKEPYFATNLLEEIDTPGEWCVDFKTKRLYLLPPEKTDLAKSVIILADSAQPILTLSGASKITLTNLELYGSLGDGVLAKDSSDITLAGIHVHGTGTDGIHVSGGSNVTVLSCDVSNTGAIGIHVTGGDRKTLTPANHTIRNNHVWATGRTDRSVYAIDIEGVNIHVAKNLVHDVPLGGIRYSGNNHLIELNEVHNLGLEGGDLGAFYVNGDWAGRNNTVRMNFVHHSPNANGVYLDDGRSGDLAINNLFYQVRSGTFFGGGHDNTSHGNVIIDCKIGLHLDDRGKARNYTRNNKGALTRTLDTLDLKSPPWSTAYPELHTLLAEPDRLPVPTRNTITDNLLIGVEKPFDFGTDTAQIRKDNTIDNNTELPKARLDLFEDPAQLNFLPGSNADLLRQHKGYAQIPLGQIGLYVDPYRTSLPTNEETGRLTSHPTRTVFNSETDINASNKAGH